MRLHVVVAVAILSCAILAGCAESRAFTGYREEMASWSLPKQVGITFKDWFLDGMDVVSLEVGIGETIGVVVCPTELAQTGFLFGDVMKFGCRDRGVGFYRDVRKEGGVTGITYYRDMRIEPIVGNKLLMDRPRIVKEFPLRINEDRHWGDIGAEVGVIMLQVSAHVSPKQILDFAVTTATLPYNIFVRPIMLFSGVHVPEIDICEDDTAAVLRETYGFETIKHPEGFAPAEGLHDLMKVPY